MIKGKRIEEHAKALPSEVVQAGRQVYLAGLGAFGMAGTTTESVFGMLVEEGRHFHARQSKKVGKVVDQAVEVVEQAVHAVDKTVDKTSKAALARLGMPTRKDIADLSHRVESLTAKVESLSKKGAAHHAS